MNSHLVTVEVSVKGCANERVQLNGLTFDQLRFKSLNTQTVQRRSTVEHYRVFVNHLFEDIPNDRLLIINHLLGGFDRHGQTTTFQLIEDEGFE